MNKTFIAAFVILVLCCSTSFAGWYVMPTVVQAYYPATPVYAYSAPMVVTAQRPYVAYMPVAQPATYTTYMPLAQPAAPCVYNAAPVVAPVPVVVTRPAVVRTKVFYPGEPVRNVVKAVVP